MATILHADGRRTPLAGTKPGGFLTLEQCQAAVGGLIDRVPVIFPESDSDHDEMVVSDEGLMHDFPHNPQASAIAGQPIVGDVILVRVAGDDGSEWA